MKRRETRVCVGAFAGAHGVHGDAKLKAFTADPGNIDKYGPVESEDKQHQFNLKFIRILKNDIVLVRSKQITSRENAAELAGTRLYVSREKLPQVQDDEFYHADLVGLEVRIPDEEMPEGRPIGEISSVHNFGAGDIIEINNMARHGGPKGAHLVAFSLEVVPSVFITEGFVILNPDFMPVKTSPDEKQIG